jgi:uncharacterized membrane protein
MKDRKVLGSAIAMAAASMLIANGALAQDKKATDKPKAEKKFKCVGGNSCKGKSECGVPNGHSCHTQNSCKGKGWIMVVDEKECVTLKAKNEKPAEGKKSR